MKTVCWNTQTNNAMHTIGKFLNMCDAVNERMNGWMDGWMDG